MFLPNWIRRGGEGKVYVEQGSLPVFIRRNRCSKVGPFILERQVQVGFPFGLRFELKSLCLTDRRNDDPATGNFAC